MKSKNSTSNKAKATPLWLKRLGRKMPERLAAFEIKKLIALTAECTGAEAPSVKALRSEERLKLFRQFTVSALDGKSGEELTALRENMYREAFALGKKLGRLPGIRDDIARSRLVKLLYRNIDITIRGDMPGEIRVPHCSFSPVYTPQICYVMSGMDAGIICGIFGGGSLKFSRRLTEGCAECLAEYKEDADGSEEEEI